MLSVNSLSFSLAALSEVRLYWSNEWDFISIALLFVSQKYFSAIFWIFFRLSVLSLTHLGKSAIINAIRVWIFESVLLLLPLSVQMILALSGREVCFIKHVRLSSEHLKYPSKTFFSNFIEFSSCSTDSMICEVILSDTSSAMVLFVQKIYLSMWKST